MCQLSIDPMVKPTVIPPCHQHTQESHLDLSMNTIEMVVKTSKLLFPVTTDDECVIIICQPTDQLLWSGLTRIDALSSRTSLYKNWQLLGNSTDSLVFDLLVLVSDLNGIVVLEKLAYQ